MRTSPVLTLVFGAIKGLEFAELKPFLDSLYQTGFDGKVVFYVGQASQPTCKALDDRGVEILTVDEYNTFTATPRTYQEQGLTGVRDRTFHAPPSKIDPHR